MHQRFAPVLPHQAGDRSPVSGIRSRAGRRSRTARAAHPAGRPRRPLDLGVLIHRPGRLSGLVPEQLHIGLGRTGPFIGWGGPPRGDQSIAGTHLSSTTARTHSAPPAAAGERSDKPERCLRLGSPVVAVADASDRARWAMVDATRRHRERASCMADQLAGSLVDPHAALGGVPAGTDHEQIMMLAGDRTLERSRDDASLSTAKRAPGANASRVAASSVLPCSCTSSAPTHGAIPGASRHDHDDHLVSARGPRQRRTRIAAFRPSGSLSTPAATEESV